ncbi:hypothetical protein KIMH_06950 [Bombiscardovia apis]|uniref:Endolytic murein transglycosylase n=1 Tax=Bombiscardovia apis TaxID=2932182 RepID=A0ABM8BCE0_9BIFI|nr:endolytic transglycosylase MltG [Bombiscardovia apis]BDR54584.1 hypothetical protein KIMH_06950 [Bombiscardovia apis]
MPDDMHDFFASDEHWASADDLIPATAPPPPPLSRRQKRQALAEARERAKRRRIIGLVIAVIACVSVVVCAVIGVNFIRNASNRFEPTKTIAADWPGPGSGSVEFSIETGQGADLIARNLVKAGVVKSSEAFLQALSNEGATGRIQPGVFQLKSQMKSSDVVTILTDPKQAGGFLEVRAGDRARDVIARAARISGLQQADFDAIVNAKGNGILPPEAAGSFEGWLEPGTYNVKEMKSAQQVLRTIVDKRIAKLDALGLPQGAQREDLLNIASIAEAEVNKSDYYGKVVRVIDNRVQQGMTLGMDSTVAYSNNVSALKLTNDMLNDSSDPYNTRVHKGLPPTPIGNAGDRALQAALKPEAGNWLYFVTVNMDTGETKFTSSSQEFNSYVQEYKAWESQHNAG